MQSISIFSKIIRFFVAFVVAVFLSCFESHADDCVLGTDGCAPEFTVTTTELSAGTTFSFEISAAGTYYIDWGDGGAIEPIVKNSVGEQIITHTYTNAGQYTIGMSGQATLYSILYTSAAISFTNNTNISGISGSLGAIFGTLTDRVNSDGTLMSDAQPRFYYTFYGCSNLSGNIPENLFAGINGAPADYMFAYTFYNCSGLSGSIPENLFAGIKGAPANWMFYYTFYNCSGLSGSIPENLFAGINGAPAYGVFSNTFSGCSGLTGSIPENLFAGIGGAPVHAVFSSTFSGCSGLTGSIPENLFAGIEGAPASRMFNRTFFGCSGLTGSIPENLFVGISGAPTESMFDGTFYGCSGLTGSIPENLFAGISGTPASYMFYITFYGCRGLTGYVPKNLFAGIDKTTTANDQMSSVFGASGLSTSCPADDYQYLTGFESYFDGKVACDVCPNDFPDSTSGDNATIDKCYTTCPEKADDPVVSGHKYYTIDGLGNTESCKYKSEVGAKFSVTTKELVANTTFSFTISAAGTYYIDWGDGGKIETIVKNTVGEQSITHTYANAGQYTIDILGHATLYSTRDTIAAISFKDNTNISGISGSLGAIFGTLTDRVNSDGSLMSDAQPRFYHTFYGCSGLTGSIPENLFAGISGAPTESMFDWTFSGCSGLTGSIPENLFAGISGAPTESMFDGTFYGCSGLTGSIPENLFAGIEGAPASRMFSWTFSGCSGLTGSIPENLFAGISGAPTESMFAGTFNGCSGLTGSIPENLFVGIEGVPASGMFNSTFSGCGGLTGSIPENLFAGISGAPADLMFTRTFMRCNGLIGYVPKNLFAGIDKTTTATSQMLQVFYGTVLATLCPASTYQYLTGFESYFDGKVACEVCPDNFPDSTSGDNATINKCYLPCEPIDGKIVTGGHKYYTEDGVGDASSCVYANGYTVTYHANGGIGEMPISEFVSGTTYNLPTNAFIRDGYTFIGWSTSPDGAVDYIDGATVTNMTDVAGGNVDLYAVWGQACTKICEYNFACPANATCVNDINFTTDGLGNTSTCNAYDSVCPLTSMNCNFGYYDANPTAEKLAELSGYLMNSLETELTLILSCSVYGTDEVVEGNVLGLPDNGVNDCDFVVPGEIAIISVPADISEPWGMATMNAYSSYNADTPGALLLMGGLPYLSNANFSFEKLSDGDNLWLKLSKLYVPTVETEVIIEVLISEDFTQEMFEQLGNKLSQDTYNMFIEVMNNPDTAGLFKLLFNTLQPVQSDYDWLMYETGITAEMAQEEFGFINYGAVLWFQFIAEGVADILPKTYGLPYCAKNQININWDLGYGDNNVSTTTCSYADVIEYPTDPVRPGYTFTGWKLVE